MNKKIRKLAKILVNHSIKVKRGELIQLKFGGPGKPLIDELAKLISQKGAYSIITLRNSAHVKHAPISALKKEIPMNKELTHGIDSLISIDDREDLYELNKINTKRLNTVAIAHNKSHSYLINNKKWCIVRYPTQAYAQQAEMSLEEYTRYAFKTMNKDWNKEKKQLMKIKRKLDKTSQVRITGEKTDLSFSIKNRNSEPCYGQNNMPDGEVFTAPNKKSTNGRLFIPVAYYNSKRFNNIELEFKNGKIVNHKVSNNKKELTNILSADNNSRYLGEFGIGTNKQIKKVVGDILFDEKKGGTIHLALGSAYHTNFKEDLTEMNELEVMRLTNTSAIHWDMIMKPTKILLDGKKLII